MVVSKVAAENILKFYAILMVSNIILLFHIILLDQNKNTITLIEM